VELVAQLLIMLVVLKPQPPFVILALLLFPQPPAA
jgi:hypothetical protein